MAERKLTGKQQAFIEHYCGDANKNATKAAELAGYSNKNNGHLRQTGCKLLTKTNIKTIIDMRLVELMAKMQVSMEEIIDNARWLVKYGKDNSHPSSVSAGNEQLGRTIAAYTDNIKQTGEGLTINVERERSEQPIKLHKGA